MSIFLDVLNSSSFILIIGLLVYIIRTKVNSDFEIKSLIKQDNINEKREVYKSIIVSFRHLFEGRTENPEDFLKAYDTALLWGSDSVIKKLTYFLDCMHERENDNIKYDNETLEYIDVLDKLNKDMSEYKKDLIKYENEIIKATNDIKKLEENYFKTKNNAVKCENDSQDKLIKILSEAIIEMRKDLDFNKTELTPKNIVFKVFNINRNKELT